MGGVLPYGSVLKVNPFSVVHSNICHLKTQEDDILALGLFVGPL